MLREPRGEEYTIAPEAVFTVRTYATGRDCELRLVRKSTGLRLQTCTSQPYTLSELRSGDKSQVTAGGTKLCQYSIGLAQQISPTSPV